MKISTSAAKKTHEMAESPCFISHDLILRTFKHYNDSNVEACGYF